VAGVGAYGMLDNRFYGKLALCRNTHVNSITDSTNVIDNYAPYWRLAWQTHLQGGYLMLGTYGLHARVLPEAEKTDSGIGDPTAAYTDTALDFQYERSLSSQDSLVVHGSWGAEKRKDVDAEGAYLMGNDSDWHFAKPDVEYNLDGRWRPGLAFFTTDTGDDNIDSEGYTLDLSYFPWENMQLQAQYSGYNRFDGESSSASDNNSLYLLLWLMI